MPIAAVSTPTPTISDSVLPRNSAAAPWPSDAARCSRSDERRSRSPTASAPAPPPQSPPPPATSQSSQASCARPGLRRCEYLTVLLGHHPGPVTGKRFPCPEKRRIVASDNNDTQKQAKSTPMRIVYHLGAHCTDEERLLQMPAEEPRHCLPRRASSCPGQNAIATCCAIRRSTLQGPAPPRRDTQALVLDQIMEEDLADRLILSWDSFLSLPQWALARRALPCRRRTGARLFADLPRDRGRIPSGHPQPGHLPARPSAKSSAAKAMTTSSRRHDPEESALVRCGRRASSHVNPDVPLTIWCDEDTPLIWPEVLRAVAGHAPRSVLEDDRRSSGQHHVGRRAEADARLSRQPPARNDAAAPQDRLGLPRQVRPARTASRWKSICRAGPKI